jgi:hypothetical protein
LEKLGKQMKNMQKKLVCEKAMVKTVGILEKFYKKKWEEILLD